MNDATSLKDDEEAMKGPDAPYWQAAMEEEHNSLLAHGVWKLTPLPPGMWHLGEQKGDEGDYKSMRTCRLNRRGDADLS